METRKRQKEREGNDVKEHVTNFLGKKALQNKAVECSISLDYIMAMVLIDALQIFKLFRE